MNKKPGKFHAVEFNPREQLESLISMPKGFDLHDMRIRVALGTRLKSILQAALRQQNLSSDDMSCQGMFDRLVAESDPVTAQIRLYAYQPIPFEERVLMRPSQGVIHSITLPDQTQLDCTHYSIYGLGATRPIPVNASNFEGMIGKIILSANSLPELLTQQHL